MFVLVRRVCFTTCEQVKELTGHVNICLMYVAKNEQILKVFFLNLKIQAIMSNLVFNYLGIS